MSFPRGLRRGTNKVIDEDGGDGAVVLRQVADSANHPTDKMHNSWQQSAPRIRFGLCGKRYIFDPNERYIGQSPGAVSV
eukprot:6156075-Amphidinium_carterae.1